MFSKSSSRVSDHTAPEINEKILSRIRVNIARYSNATREDIDRRLEELDREWDIERVLEANASVLALSGVVLGATVSKWWFLLSGTVLGFFLQHSLQGWCPPVPILRRLGVRTSDEINYERYALKALRGDFMNLPAAEARKGNGSVDKLFHAVTD